MTKLYYDITGLTDVELIALNSIVSDRISEYIDFIKKGAQKNNKERTIKFTPTISYDR